MSVAEDIAASVDQDSARFTWLADQLWDRPELRWAEHASMEAHIALAESEGFRVAGLTASPPRR